MARDGWQLKHWVAVAAAAAVLVAGIVSARAADTVTKAGAVECLGIRCVDSVELKCVVDASYELTASGFKLVGRPQLIEGRKTTLTPKQNE